MKTVEIILHSSIMQTIGWTLVHSLWQGLLLAVFLGAVLNLLTRSVAHTRYLICCTILVLMLVLPVTTVLLVNAEKLGSGISTVQNETGDSALPTVRPNSLSDQSIQAEIQSQSYLEPVNRIIPWLGILWIIGLIISSVRLINVWKRTQNLRKGSIEMISDKFQKSVERICVEFGISRTVKIFESAAVHTPTVIGWLKPVILIPPCALSGLTPGQLEMILAHELAHIRRNDYLFNLFQTAIETLLFYHPAVWWISGLIRNERENACDDLAVIISADALTYARTLTKLERLRQNAPSFSMAADGGLLTRRIHRLAGVEPAPKAHPGFWMILLLGMFIVFLAAGTKILSNNASAQLKGPENATQAASGKTGSESESNRFVNTSGNGNPVAENSSGNADQQSNQEKQTEHKFSNETGIKEYKVMMPRSTSKMRFVVRTTINSGSAGWTLINPSGEKELGLYASGTPKRPAQAIGSSQDLNYVEGEWIVRVEAQNAVGDFRMQWENP